MPYFNRFDVCAAHKVLEIEWNTHGWLSERPSNRKRREATHIQLDRLKFSAPSVWCFEDLEENAREIYLELCARYGFKVNAKGEPL